MGKNCHFRLARAPLEAFRKVHLGQPQPLGIQPGLAYDCAIEPLADDLQVGARHRPVEANHDVACFDAVTFADQDFADDAALLVLHLLHAAFHDHGSCCDYGAGERRPGCPQANACDEQCGNSESEEEVGADAVALPGGMCGFAERAVSRSDGSGQFKHLDDSSSVGRKSLCIEMAGIGSPSVVQRHDRRGAVIR